MPHNRGRSCPQNARLRTSRNTGSGGDVLYPPATLDALAAASLGCFARGSGRLRGRPCKHDQVTDESAAGEQLRLGDAAIAAFDVDGAVAHFSAAIRGFTAEANPCQAAMACVRLGEIYANFLGNLAAGRAWFARGARLVESEPPCVEQGWVAIAAMGCDVDDPADLLARSELALDRARTFGDVNLETKALADAGLAHVQAGRVAEGMALLDEAMALACGPADDLDTAGKSVCSFFTACYFAADFERAGSWAEMLRQRGLIGAAPFVPIVLSNHCDSVQAALLCELGRWQEAEAVLTRAIEDFERCIPGPSWHPAIALADLRVRQGRLADAGAAPARQGCPPSGAVASGQAALGPPGLRPGPGDRPPRAAGHR